MDYKHSLKVDRVFYVYRYHQVASSKTFWISKVWSYGCVQHTQYVTELWVGQPGNHSLTSVSCKRFFSLFQSVHTGSGFHPAYPVGNGSCLSMGTMWSQHETDLSSSSSAEIRNIWICTSISLRGFVMCCLIKHGITSLYLPMPIYTQNQDTYTLATLL